MNDTPQHIKELQLKIWLSKPPGERLKQFMEDNASLFQFWKAAQKSDQKASDSKTEGKSADFIMDFFSGNGRPSGLCRVRIFSSKMQDKAVIITDIGDLNPGASVTNSIKAIVSKLISEQLIDSSTFIIAHYEPGPINGHTFDIVTFDQEMLPSWESATIEQVCNRLRVIKGELTLLVEDDKKLMKEIIVRTQLNIHQTEIGGKKLKD